MDNKDNYTQIGKGTDRLEMLGYDIIALIGNAKTESANNLIEQFKNSNVVHYLMNKYPDEMFIINENCPYNLDEWEKVFEQYSYMSFGHDVRRKMGLQNEKTDGLLMLLSIILSEVSERKYK